MPMIRPKLPARSVAASRTVYVPRRLSGGIVNEWLPYEKPALVWNTVWVPRTSTIPTCETFESLKAIDAWCLNLIRCVSSASAGGVVR